MSDDFAHATARSERVTQAEDETARALATLPAEWTVMRNMTWPGRAASTIDHVVVGPGGVFAIDSKYWSGRVDVSGGVLRLNRRTRMSVVTGCSEAADVLAIGASVDRWHVHPVLCFSGQQISSRVVGVVVCAPETIAQTLVDYERVLSYEDLNAIRANIAATVAPEPSGYPVAGHGHAPWPSGPSRRTRKAGSLGRWGSLLLVAAVAIVAAPWAIDEVDELRAGKPPAMPELGDEVRLASTQVRPLLEVTADRLVGKGRRAYVVRLTVRNEGERGFAMGSVNATLILDDLRPVVVPGAQARLAGVRLRPGKERIVTYRFTVPSGRRATTLVATVGERPLDRVTWQLP